MGRFGRPTKYTDDMPERAYAVLAEGGPLSKVAATLDISLETLNVWRKDSGKSEFSEAIKRGLAVAESIWDDPDYKPDMHPTRYKAYMMHRYGWSERMSTEVTGSNGGPVAIEHSFADVDKDQAAAIAREYLVNIQSNSDDGAES